MEVNSIPLIPYNRSLCQWNRLIAAPKDESFCSSPHTVVDFSLWPHVEQFPDRSNSLGLKVDLFLTVVFRAGQFRTVLDVQSLSELRI